MDNHVAKQVDPRALGKALSGPLGTLWRYRLGDYRIVCEIRHSALRILVIRIGHRSEVYR
jgi:mRNA interferase RelE/StbE